MTTALIEEPLLEKMNEIRNVILKAGTSRLPSFELPPELEAANPPEARGITRDAVRMMVASKSTEEIVNSHFSELPRFLDEGDLVVVNTSGTLAAAISGVTRDGTPIDVHLSTRLPAGLWTVELRSGSEPVFDATAGELIDLDGGGRVELLTAYSGTANSLESPGFSGHESRVRLWVATLATHGPLQSYLAVYGRPIKYGYVKGNLPITMYQNVYANEPGSAEMPSAGRPFTPEVLTRLVAKGVGVVPIVLHTGVASLQAWEPPYPEPFTVSRPTAHRVNDTKRNGGRVIAVGTTVVRALETVVDNRGLLHAGGGWTETVITPDRRVMSVDGLLTGWHEPEASHLAMLHAIAGACLLEKSYAEALKERYLWHEFGDVHLILP